MAAAVPEAVAVVVPVAAAIAAVWAEAITTVEWEADPWAAIWVVTWEDIVPLRPRRVAAWDTIIAVL